MDIHLCFEDDVLGGLSCPHPDLDEDGYCLSCDRPVRPKPTI